MPTLRQKLTAAIAREQEELTRIQTESAEKTASTRTRLMTLQNASDALTPEIEAVLTALASVGVTVEFKG